MRFLRSGKARLVAEDFGDRDRDRSSGFRGKSVLVRRHSKTFMDKWLQNAVNIKTLLPLRGDGSGPKVEPLSSEEIKKIDVSFANWRKVWVARRKVYSE